MDKGQLSIDLPPITDEQLIRYAGASNDFNPIHTIEKKALEYGLTGVIAHGMLTMAFMGRFFGTMIENGGFIQDFHARFKAKVFVGDQLKVLVEKASYAKNEDHVNENMECVEHFMIRILNQHNEEVASGYVTINLKLTVN